MDYVLGVGINNYANCNNLENPVRDIENILDVLVNQYSFNHKNILTLFNEDATRERVINELENYTNLTPNDNLLIFYAGHGEYDSKIDLGYLLTQETIPLNKATYLEYTSIFNYLKAINTHHTLLVSDSCYSGSLFNNRNLTPNETKQRLDLIPSRWALTSGRLEPVLDGTPGKNSPFADSLIRNLRDCESTVISVTELTHLIKMDVASVVEQIPRGEPLAIKGHKGGELLFKRAIKTSIQVSSEETSQSSDQLTGIIEDYRAISNQLEKAENLKQVGTIKRLKEEKKYLDANFKDHLVNDFEIIVASMIQKEISNPSLIEEGISHRVVEIEKIKEQKNQAVRNQQYEKAADLRDLESKRLRDIEEYFDNFITINAINFSPDNLEEMYVKIDLWVKYSSVQYSSEKLLNLRGIFVDMYMLRILLENELVGKYKFSSIWKEKIDEIISALRKMRDDESKGAIFPLFSI